MPPKTRPRSRTFLEAGGLCGGWVDPGARISAAGAPGPTQSPGRGPKDGRAPRRVAPRADLLRRGRVTRRTRLPLLLLAASLLLEVARDRDAVAAVAPSRRARK